MMRPVIRFLLADRGRNRHLRHDRRAAAADQALIDQYGIGAIPRGGDRGVHAGAACANHQNIATSAVMISIKFLYDGAYFNSCVRPAENRQPPVNSRPLVPNQQVTDRPMMRVDILGPGRVGNYFL